MMFSNVIVDIISRRLFDFRQSYVEIAVSPMYMKKALQPEHLIL